MKQIYFYTLIFSGHPNEALMSFFLSVFLSVCLHFLKRHNDYVLGTKGNQGELKGVRRSKEESKGPKRSQEESRGVKRSQEESREIKRIK